MKLDVKITTPQASGTVVVHARTISKAFAQIPTKGAMRGLGLLNDGRPVVYEVRVVDPRPSA